MSSAPGDGGTVSAWAISTRTHAERVGGGEYTPITLRERPRGVEKRCTRTDSPARVKRRRIRTCARRSATPAAGRAPWPATKAANRRASSPGPAKAAATSAAASTPASRRPRAGSARPARS